MDGWKVARLEEIDEQTDGRCPWRPVRHHFGITAFGVNAWTGRDAGDRIINEHDEEDEQEEELYFVSAGRASFEIGGERVGAPAGTFVFVRPGLKRTAFAEEPGTTIVAVGGVPGQAYQAMGWELWAPLREPYEAGRYDEVIARGRELLATTGDDYSLPLYNLACVESLAGHTEDAIEHLRRAIAVSEQARSYAQGDSDFDPIRDEPAFRELVEPPV